MRQHIEQLHQISQKPERLIIGLMSGTSLDGLDVALCRISGSGKNTRVSLDAFKTVEYDVHFKNEIRRVFAKKQIEFQHLVLLNALIAERHAAIVRACLEEWKVPAAQIDLIASHGQTVFHAPRVFHQMDEYPNATLQIGDGDHLAVRTGIITISDFRQKHVAAGGEGAPLALYGDYYLFSDPGEHRILLNIGGIANYTWLPADDSARPFATDTGPGNTLMDAFAQQYFGVPFDNNGLLAKAGIVDRSLVDDLKKDAFFAAPLPKTIGPELFSPAWVRSAVERLPKGSPAHNPHNLMASLAALTAETIADAVKAGTSGNRGGLYLSGGGAHNPVVKQALSDLLPDWNLSLMDAIGVSGDAKEAVLFAVLANECVAGTDTNSLYPGVTMGKISLPG